MNGADHVFTIILLLSALLGYLRGFLRESIALLTWLIALWAAWHFAYLLNPWLGGALAKPGVQEWAGRTVVFVVVLLAGSATGAIVSYFAQRAAGLAMTDRVLGILFGLVRGVVVIGLLVILGRAVGLAGEEWWQRTRSMPVAETAANWLERYAEPAAEDLLEKAKEEPGT